MFIYYVFLVSLITESYKQNLIEQAQNYLLYFLEIVTNKLLSSQQLHVQS